jgi:UDPglucose 6-dehydrogenase
VVEACDRADAVLVLTEWQEFIDLDPDALTQTVRCKVVVDGRNCLDAGRWTSAGWKVYGLGRSVR